MDTHRASGIVAQLSAESIALDAELDDIVKRLARIRSAREALLRHGEQHARTGANVWTSAAGRISVSRGLSLVPSPAEIEKQITLRESKIRGSA